MGKYIGDVYFQTRLHYMASQCKIDQVISVYHSYFTALIFKCCLEAVHENESIALQSTFLTIYSKQEISKYRNNPLKNFIDTLIKIRLVQSVAMQGSTKNVRLFLYQFQYKIGSTLKTISCYTYYSLSYSFANKNSHTSSCYFSIDKFEHFLKHHI